MANSITANAKYAKWQKTHNFDNCKLNLKSYGEFFGDYLTSEHNGFVLNLNGAWGTGKTEFLKRLYSYLLQKQHPAIYIDAWESDFSKEPLTVVTSELLSQLEQFNGEIGSQSSTTKVKKYCGKALKASLVGLAGFTTAKLLYDSSIGIEAVKQLIESDSVNFTSKLTKDYVEQIEAIHKIRDSLEQLAEVLEKSFGFTLPVVVLVDEMDRCRPTYAIEMLEVIKHFFSTKHFVFVVATDTDQLCNSITAVYGDKFDSQQYLKRFFDRKANLPEPDIKSYISTLKNDYSAYSTLDLFPLAFNNQAQEEMINWTIAVLSEAYDLKIRDTDQLIGKINSCLRSAISSEEKTKKKQVINFAALVIGLIEQDKGFSSFNERSNYTTNITEPTNKKVKIFNEFFLSSYIRLNMKSIIKYDITQLGTYENKNQIKRLLNREEVKNYNLQYLNKGLIDFITLFGDKMAENSLSITETKYWLWSDLKKVIELSGNIE